MTKDESSRKRNRTTSTANSKNCRAKAQSESRDDKTGYPVCKERVVEANDEACAKSKKESGKPEECGSVVYWMSHTRIRSNSALLYAHQRAREMRKPLAVVINVGSRAPRGIVDMQTHLRKFGITLFPLKGDPMANVPNFVRENRAVLLVTDFCRSRAQVSYKRRVVANVDCKIVEVDGHSVVPVRYAKPKINYAARIIRPRMISAQLPKNAGENVITQPVVRPSKLSVHEQTTIKAMDTPRSPSSIVGESWTQRQAALKAIRQVVESAKENVAATIY